MKQRALIDIDMLLDTRYGTLRRMDPVLADALAGSNAYRTRDHDQFDRLTNGVIARERFDEMYKKRDIETLAESRVTDFLYFLRKDVKQAIPEVARHVEVTDISFDINLYPYEVLPSEAEIIRRSIARYIPAQAEVNAVNISPQELTPQAINASYEMFAYYNHEDWLIHHQEALLKKPINTTVLLTPRIATSGIVPSPTAELADAFLCRSALLVKWVALQYLPTYYMCWNPLILKNLEEGEDQSSET